MSRYNRRKAEKIKKYKERISKIPAGPYCYGGFSIATRCPYFKHKGGKWVTGCYKGEDYKEKVSYVKCTLRGHKEVGGFYLWDQVKICGINDDWED